MLGYYVTRDGTASKHEVSRKESFVLIGNSFVKANPVIMAASKECRDVNECSQMDVTGIIMSCGDTCKGPSSANGLFCRFKNGARSSAVYDVENSTFKCDPPNVSGWLPATSQKNIRL